MSRRKVIIVAVASLIGLFIIYHIGKAIFSSGASGQKMPPVPVETAVAEKQMWQDQIQATGTISAIEGVQIRPEVSGRITKIYFTSGTEVQKGQPLFQIYPDILQAQLANDQAALQLAQVNYDRAVALYQKKVIAKEQLDSATSTLQRAQASLDQTKASLVQHNIVAPFAGRIGLKQVDVGDYVTAGSTNLVDLQRMDPLRVQYSVPDRYINQLKMGDKAEVRVSSMPNTIYMGTVYAYEAAVDPSTRSYSMWAKIPNPNESLIPGTYVDITMFVGAPHPVIAVPQTAALFNPQGEYTYRVVDGKAVKTPITVGMRKDNLIEVKEGLQAGDVVVTAGQVKIFGDGAPVIPTPTKTYPPTAPNSDKVISSSDTSNPEKPDAIHTTTNAKPAANAAAQSSSAPANASPAPATPAATANTPSASPATAAPASVAQPAPNASVTPTPASGNNAAAKPAQ